MPPRTPRACARSSPNPHFLCYPTQAVPEDLPPRLTVFHGLRAPPITTEAYLLRIAKYAKCSPACFVAALGYMQRLSGRDAALAPTTLNVHRLLLTGVLCAAKFLDDRYYNNAFYAKVGGISTLELNRLELEMLQLLEFRLAISPEAVATLLAQLHSGSYVLEAAGGGGAALLPPGALLGACCEAGAAPRASSDTVAGSAGGVLYGRKRRSINGNSCEVDARRLQRRSMEVVEA